MTLPEKVAIVGTEISLTSYGEVLEILDTPPPAGRARTVAFCNVHSVIEARDDEDLAKALHGMDLATPDGVPLVWALRALGHPEQQRVYGPDLMELALRQGVDRGWTHFFFGSTEDTLARLVERAREMAPGIRIAGTLSPPFRSLTDHEVDDAVATIVSSGARQVWVGLGMPKQEKLIGDLRDRLPGCNLLAVGAAFAMHAGDVRQAPDWIQRAGMEWLYRLVQEPGRLWRRYARTNPRFVVLLARQLAAARISGGRRWPWIR